MPVTPDEIRNLLITKLKLKSPQFEYKIKMGTENVQSCTLNLEDLQKQLDTMKQDICEYEKIRGNTSILASILATEEAKDIISSLLEDIKHGEYTLKSPDTDTASIAIEIPEKLVKRTPEGKFLSYKTIGYLQYQITFEDLFYYITEKGYPDLFRHKEAYRRGKAASLDSTLQESEIKNAQDTLKNAQEQLSLLQKQYKEHLEELLYLKTEAKTDPKYLCGLTTVEICHTTLKNIKKEIGGLERNPYGYATAATIKFI